MSAMASGVTVSCTSCSASRRMMASTCRRTMSSISSFLSGWNMMMSSIRFKNSGRMVFFSISSTSLFVSSRILACLASGSPRIASNFCWMNWLPRLEVMMMIVFLKLTTRPLLSVRRPSSSTCSKILNTSGCAFSISSKSTTE